MRVLEVSIRRFRGFEELTFQPGRHVALIGEPRAGRSDLIEGLRRVLTSYGVRHTTPSELDLWMVDTARRAEVEVVLGNLGPDLEQDFLDHIEAWDAEEGTLASPKPPTQAVSIDETAWVLRLCYRIKWQPDHEQAVHWVDFPDESDPGSDTYARVPRRLQDLLPVVVAESRRQPLHLGSRSDFRKIADGVDRGNLEEAFNTLVDAVTEAGADLAKAHGIKTAVAEILKPVEGPLGIDASDDKLLLFAPEGGSLSGILRSLQPAVDLGGPGHLPLRRQGATAAGLLQAGEMIGAIGRDDAVVLVDDFGEDLDSISARHLSSVFRRCAGQAWISTRRSAAVEAFPPQHIVRLYFKDDSRRAAQLEELTTKSERVAARHLSIQLLPAASAAVVVIVEGPHDRAALDAIANRLNRTDGQNLPASHGIAVIDAGVMDSSGGAAAVARLASLATRLGFHTIGIIDGDKGADGKAYLDGAKEAALRVIRLPDGGAIELALIKGLHDSVVIQTLKAVCTAFDVTPKADLDTYSGSKLLKEVVSVLKKNGGLHAQFVELLPRTVIPPLLQKIFDEIISSGDDRLEGVVQL